MILYIIGESCYDWNGDSYGIEPTKICFSAEEMENEISNLLINNLLYRTQCYKYDKELGQAQKIWDGEQDYDTTTQGTPTRKTKIRIDNLLKSLECE